MVGTVAKIAASRFEWHALRFWRVLCAALTVCGTAFGGSPELPYPISSAEMRAIVEVIGSSDEQMAKSGLAHQAYMAQAREVLAAEESNSAPQGTDAATLTRSWSQGRMLLTQLQALDSNLFSAIASDLTPEQASRLSPIVRQRSRDLIRAFHRQDEWFNWLRGDLLDCVSDLSVAPENLDAFNALVLAFDQEFTDFLTQFSLLSSARQGALYATWEALGQHPSTEELDQQRQNRAKLLGPMESLRAKFRKVAFGRIRSIAMLLASDQASLLRERFYRIAYSYSRSFEGRWHQTSRTRCECAESIEGLTAEQCAAIRDVKQWSHVRLMDTIEKYVIGIDSGPGESLFPEEADPSRKEAHEVIAAVDSECVSKLRSIVAPGMWEKNLICLEASRPQKQSNDLAAGQQASAGASGGSIQVDLFVPVAMNASEFEQYAEWVGLDSREGELALAYSSYVSEEDKARQEYGLKLADIKRARAEAAGGGKGVSEDVFVMRERARVAISNRDQKLLAALSSAAGAGAEAKMKHIAAARELNTLLPLPVLQAAISAPGSSVNVVQIAMKNLGQRPLSEELDAALVELESQVIPLYRQRFSLAFAAAKQISALDAVAVALAANGDEQGAGEATSQLSATENRNFQQVHTINQKIAETYDGAIDKIGPMAGPSGMEFVRQCVAAGFPRIFEDWTSSEVAWLRVVPHESTNDAVRKVMNTAREEYKRDYEDLLTVLVTKARELELGREKTDDDALRRMIRKIEFDRRELDERIMARQRLARASDRKAPTTN